MVFAPKEGIHRRVEVLLIIYIYLAKLVKEWCRFMYYMCSSMFYSLSFCSLLHVYNRCHYVSMQAVGVLAVLATGAKLGPF